MAINSVKLVYFSPTGTTRRVLEGIAQGIEATDAEHLDLTLPNSAVQKPAGMVDLVILGAPVYAGRLPAEAVSRLRQINGNGTPAVIVVVYGNRAYEDALLELRDLALEAGFKPVAAAAFIGEHSFSTVTTPIAAGRPDREDLRKANEFGRTIGEKLSDIKAHADVQLLQVPGNIPYKERMGLSGVSPAIEKTLCAGCGGCAQVCPTAAITGQDTDASICIRCCACVKACMTGARTMADPRIGQVAQQLSSSCRERKEPEIYGTT